MIGLWIARFADQGHGKRLTLWHLVESEIADRKVTRCGRQMATTEGTVLAPLVAPPSSTQACFWCQRQKMVELADGDTITVLTDESLRTGDLRQYDQPRLNAVVYDASACDVWVNGREEPAGGPKERKNYALNKE